MLTLSFACGAARSLRKVKRPQHGLPRRLIDGLHIDTGAKEALSEVPEDSQVTT